MGGDETGGRVLILKDRSISLQDDGRHDLYEQALANAGYAAHFLPVLSHRLVNLDKIAEVIAADLKMPSTASEAPSGRPAGSDAAAAAAKFTGVVFTSQRAVKAWAKAGEAVLRSNATLRFSWNTLPFYAVGPATASALLRLDSRLRPPPSLILGADETGNAIKLASFISTHPFRASTGPLLYLSGDKRKDTLESLLNEQGVKMYEIQAYETFQSPTFEENYSSVREQGPFQWIVFFSPSGAKMLLPLMDSGGSGLSAKIAAIGPTTRDYLLSQDIDVAAMAESPNPDSLVESMASADTP